LVLFSLLQKAPNTRQGRLKKQADDEQMLCGDLNLDRFNSNGHKHSNFLVNVSLDTNFVEVALAAGELFDPMRCARSLIALKTDHRPPIARIPVTSRSSVFPMTSSDIVGNNLARWRKTVKFSENMICDHRRTKGVGDACPYPSRRRTLPLRRHKLKVRP